jgi:phosphoglycolate phosphatase
LPLRALIFDLDGTLVDGYEGITTGVNAAREHFGMAPLAPDDVRGRVGLGLSHLMIDVVGAERAEEGAAVFRAVYDAVCDVQTHAAPGLTPTLERLRSAGVRMSVASNKPVLYSVRILERLAVLPYFDLVAGPETAGAIKPDPAMLRACLQAMKAVAGDAVYVGDLALDAETGRRAGVRVVLVAGGSSASDELRGTGCPVIPTLSDLPGLLD